LGLSIWPNTSHRISTPPPKKNPYNVSLIIAFTNYMKILYNFQYLLCDYVQICYYNPILVPGSFRYFLWYKKPALFLLSAQPPPYSSSWENWYLLWLNCYYTQLCINTARRKENQLVTALAWYFLGWDFLFLWPCNSCIKISAKFSSEWKILWNDLKQTH
jgi:hypothetical protein